MIKNVNSNKAPEAIGPYSQAIETDNFVFVSGQIPIDRNTGEFKGDDIKSQTTQSLLNIKYILEELGLDMSKVVKTTVLLKDMNDFKDMNEVYASFFKEPYPARACFEVAALPKGAKVEIEAIVSKN